MNFCGTNFWDLDGALRNERFFEVIWDRLRSSDNYFGIF